MNVFYICVRVCNLLFYFKLWSSPKVVGYYTDILLLSKIKARSSYRIGFLANIILLLNLHSLLYRTTPVCIYELTKYHILMVVKLQWPHGVLHLHPRLDSGSVSRISHCTARLMQ